MVRSDAFHPQDWLLIAEALSQWRLELHRFEPARAERAAELVEAIVDEQGLDPMDFGAQIDDEWAG